jgi:hypothetical protein
MWISVWMRKSVGAKKAVSEGTVNFDTNTWMFRII